MKKQLFIFWLMLPFCAFAQNFKTLVHQGDSLWKKSKYKQAKILYDKAIDRAVTYQEKVSNGDWQHLSIISTETNIKVNPKLKSTYIHIKYGVDSEIFKNKISDLQAHGVKCIFTYCIGGGMIGSSYLVVDPLTKTSVGIGTSFDRRYLVWAGNDGVFIQPFDNFNVYKPVQILNREIIDICQRQYDQVLNEEIEPLRMKVSEQSNFQFNFYNEKQGYLAKTFDNDDLVDPLQHRPKGRPVTRDIYFKHDMVNYAKNYISSLGQLALLLAEEIKSDFPLKS